MEDKKKQEADPKISNFSDLLPFSLVVIEWSALLFRRKRQL